MNRIVEQKVITAIRNKQSIGANNTMVTYNANKDFARIYLHGSLIAEISYRKRIVRLNPCGYQTNVTKSRLNCVLEGVGLSNLILRQRNYKWEIYDRITGEIKPFGTKWYTSF